MCRYGSLININPCVEVASFECILALTGVKNERTTESLSEFGIWKQKRLEGGGGEWKKK